MARELGVKLGLGGGKPATSGGAPAAAGVTTVVNTKSVDYDGAGDLMTAGNIGELGAAFSLWLKPDAAIDRDSSLGAIAVFDGGYKGLLNGPWNPAYAPDMILQVYETAGGYACAWDHATEEIPSGSWTHVLINSGEPTYGYGIYVDGVQKANVVGAVGRYPRVANMNMSNLEVGGNGTYMFAGLIDEVAAWNTALSAAEIAEIYANGRGGETINLAVDSGDYASSDDLVGYWRADGSTDPTVADLSGEGNNGALSADATIVTAAP